MRWPSKVSNLTPKSLCN